MSAVTKSPVTSKLPVTFAPPSTVSNLSALLKYINCPAPELVCMLTLLPAAFVIYVVPERILILPSPTSVI